MHRALLVSCTVALFGCAGQAASLIDDGEPETLEDSAADSASSTSTYYVARQDLRRCVSPVCGGLWVHRVNFATTRCADGTHAAECYVAGLDLERIGLVGDDASSFTSRFASGQALVRGTFVAGPTFGSTTFSNLRAREGWLAATESAPEGTFYRVRDNMIRCITTPCFSLHEAKLNSTINRDLSGLDLTGSGATEAQIESAWPDLASTSGLLVAGANLRVGRGVELDATQFYTLAQPSPVCASDADCTASGYAHPISSSSECYCARCATTPMLASEASANQALWDTYCAATPPICPAVLCRIPPTVACVAGACVAQ